MTESRLENFRIRKLVLMYFLEDHTVMISEPRETNSGVPQGKFLKRRQLLREDGSGLALLPTDFRVGTEVKILGRQIRICDCDEYTREFYEFQGKPQPKPEDIPRDSFAQNQIKVPKVKEFNDMKEFMERSLGGGRVPCEKQFLDNDRKVLRFYTRYDDIPYIVHYYLADDTCEIREVHHPNDGRDNFALLLKRRKIPYSFNVSQPGLGFIGDNYLTYNQIYPGSTIDAFGRNFLITGVDEFTQNFYEAKLGRSFKLGEIEYPRPRSPTQR